MARATTTDLTGADGALAGFSKIGDWTYLLEPRVAAAEKKPVSWTSPSLIVLLAWLDATPRHVRLYVAHYSLRHPMARIAVVFTNKVHLFLTGEAAQQQRLKPVLDLVAAAKSSSWSSLGNSSTHGVLIHAFSNGGSMQLALLERMHYTAYRQPLPATAIFLDSCPGLATYWRSVAALTYSLPRNRIYAALVGSLVVTGLTLIFVFGWLLRKLKLRSNNNLVIRMRSDLLDDRFLRSDTRLTYLYSAEDKMIAAADVESHIAAAKAKGFNVMSYRFDKSKHVAHAYTHPELYWQIVEDRWDKCVSDDLD